MKKITTSILILLFLSSWMLAQDSDCSRKTLFGTTEICLPKINGYEECYTEPVVKALADATEVETNMVLGYYLNNDTYAKIDSLEFINFEDYFKIYGTKQIQDYEADAAILKQMQEMLSGNFLTKNWDAVQEGIESMEHDLDIEIGIPVVIDEYKLTDNSFTLMMINKYQLDGEESFTMALTMNGLLIHERLVWMAYYLDYKGEKTMSRLRHKSDNILRQLLIANE